MWLAIFRLETFVCGPSVANCRLDISLGNFLLRSFALKHSLVDFSFGSFVWQLSPGIFLLIYSAGMFRLETVVYDLSLRNFRLEYSRIFRLLFASNRFLGIFHLEPFGIVRLETSCRLSQPAGSSVWISSRIFRWDSFACNRCGSFARKRPAGFRRPAGTFVLEFLLGSFRLRSSALEVSIGSFRLGSFAW